MWTPRIIDVLEGFGVRGTFFVVGERADRARDVVSALATAGHEVANHSWSHRSLWFCGPQRTSSEIARCHDLLGELTGAAPRYFRPPWGMVNAAMFGVLRRLDERCVFWSIQPEGLRPQSADDQVASVVRRARAGAIVDLHDAEGVTGAPGRLVDALPPMIAALREAGYDLVPLRELLVTPPAAPRRSA